MLKEPQKERRRHPRYAMRLQVEFGTEELSFQGITDDVSNSGLLIVTSEMVPVGQRVHLKVSYGENRWNHFEAEVRRVTRNSDGRMGLGVRFLFPEVLIDEMVSFGADARIDHGSKRRSSGDQP